MSDGDSIRGGGALVGPQSRSCSTIITGARRTSCRGGCSTAFTEPPSARRSSSASGSAQAGGAASRAKVNSRVGAAFIRVSDQGRVARPAHTGKL
jgi:hypothetical protein